MADILLVTNDFGPRAGGIETFVIGLLERIPAGRVIVYTSSQPASESYDLQWESDFQVKVIRDKSRVLLPSPRVVKKLQAIIRKNKIETIWFGAAAPLGFSARWLRKAGAKKLVAITHGHEVWWSKLWPFSLAMREIARQLDFATYLGDFTKNALESTFQEKSKLIRVAPGIDTDHFKPTNASNLRSELGLADRPTIISVGRLVHRKGQDRLIEALPMIIASIPNVALVFVGEGPHRKVLQNLVKKNNLQKHVYFIGRISYAELPKYICIGDVFAMPSRSRFFGLEVEGLGIVYLEASASGLPVIAGSSGGAPDAVLNGETGFVVDGNNLAEIAQVCVRLLSDKELQRAMGNKGRDWAVENWGWQIWSQKFNNLLGI